MKKDIYPERQEWYSCFQWPVLSFSSHSQSSHLLSPHFYPQRPPSFLTLTSPCIPSVHSSHLQIDTSWVSNKNHYTILVSIDFYGCDLFNPQSPMFKEALLSCLPSLAQLLTHPKAGRWSQQTSASPLLMFFILEMRRGEVKRVENSYECKKDIEKQRKERKRGEWEGVRWKDERRMTERKCKKKKWKRMGTCRVGDKMNKIKTDGSNEGYIYPNSKEPISITNDFTLADGAHLNLYKQHPHPHTQYTYECLSLSHTHSLSLALSVSLSAWWSRAEVCSCCF